MRRTSWSWIFIGFLFAALHTAGLAQVATTQVADTIYHADGTAAGGTVLISWPAFTAASGDQIPGGNASVNIASGGALSVRLVPNSGAIPIGSYYTATYHLDDNTVTRQYWVVPQSATPVRLAAIVSTVLPVSVAMQTVTKSYVDSAVAAAAGGQTSSVTGQTPGCVPKAATSTTSTSSFPECDDGTTTTFTHPLTAPQVKAQLPRVDVTAFGADSTCRTDATAGVQAAYTFALAHYASNAMPVIYFPHGCYLISSELRWSADVGITGDGQSATTIKLTNNSANGFTITAPTLLTDDLSYNGFMRDLTIQAANGHNYIADEVELLNAHGYRLYDLQIRGGGGRCINLVTETERVTGTNIYLNKCRLPLVSAGDTDVWRNIHIAAPGQADDGYCYSENCVNGVHPMVNWLTALTPVSAVGSGSTLTVVVQGDTTGGTFNYNPGGLTAGGPGISPLIPGHKFKLAGAAGTTCVNGFWIVASVTNNTASDQFTVTASSGINAAGVTIPTSCTGTASLGSATFQPALQPNHHPAVSIRGEEDVFEGGELKSTQYSTAFVHREGALTLKSVYVEGFAYLPTAAQYPTLSSSLEYPGLPQTTTLTGVLPASTAAATTTVADNRWLPYVTSLSDADGAGNFHVMRILPCDYLIGSTATSSCNPSVQRGQYENVYAMGYGTNGMRIVSRNLSGSTAPSGTAWAAGSFLGEIANIGEPFYSVIFENMNAHAINSAGGSNWAPLCIDGTIYTCGEVLIGNVPNELTSFSYGENYANGFIGGQQGAVNIQSGSFVFDPSVGGLIGQAAVKFVGVGGTGYVGGGFFPPFMLPGGLDGTGVTTGNLTAGNSTYAPAEYNAQAPDGSYPSVQWKSEPNDINLSFQDPYGNSTLSKEITKGNDSNLSGTVGRQFANQRCWVDMSNTTGGHAGYRWCASGGPTGTAGLTWDKWNGSAWVSQFGVDGSGNTSAAGNMHVGGTFDSISMAACGHKIFLGDPGNYLDRDCSTGRTKLGDNDVQAGASLYVTGATTSNTFHLVNPSSQAYYYMQSVDSAVVDQARLGVTDCVACDPTFAPVVSAQYNNSGTWGLSSFSAKHLLADMVGCIGFMSASPTGPWFRSTPDTCLQRDSAGAMSLHSGYNGALGTLSLGTANATTVSATTTASTVYQGPPAAPTGSCSVVGWAFSQDGHISYCNGTAWALKM